MDSRKDFKPMRAPLIIYRRPANKARYQNAREAGLRGLNLVIEELNKRGVSVEKAEGRAYRLIIRSKDESQPVNIRVKTKG